MRYIDTHCDTLLRAHERNIPDIYSLPDQHVDLERLVGTGTSVQFFAAFVPQEGSWPNGFSNPDDAVDGFWKLHKLLFDSLSRTDKVAFAKNMTDIRRNEAEGKASAVLTIENGYPVGGKMERLKMFREAGVSLITLTWNDPTCFGYPNSTDPDEMAKGLTPFGIEAVPVMNDLGIIIDVSHLSDGGFYDVAKYSKKPFMASHSNCRAIGSYPRNLTDDMIRVLADRGGYSGLNFFYLFLHDDPKDEGSHLHEIADHIEHFVKVGGEDIVGIGSDFDGIEGIMDINGCGEMYKLFDELAKRGFSERQIDKIAYGNAARVIEDCLG